MHQVSDTPPRGLILLSHPEEVSITPEEMADALPATQRSLPQRAVDLDMAAAARLAVRSRDWAAAQRALEERFSAEIEPLRDKNPDYRIVYFGSSPIPLAVHLGFLIDTWQRVDVVPHHHVQRAWGWISEPGRPSARLLPVHLPGDRDRSPGEAIIRVSTSHAVDPLLTSEMVERALCTIDISLEYPAEDAFTCPEEMQAVAQAFRKALDVIGDRFPGVQRVHLFASVQPGMALLLGTQISKTMHPAVQTYQYARNAEDQPYHTPAVLVNAPSHPPPPPLTEEEAARAVRDRARLEEDLDGMRGVAQREQRSPTSSWIARVLSRPEGPPAFSGQWLDLPALHETPLPRTKADVATRIVGDSFRLSPSGEWQIDDHWLARLARRIPDDGRRRRALRMLVLHESVHRGPQALTGTSSEGMGRFPKVLEEMDYLADVWGMLHEHALTELRSRSEVAEPRQFFMDLIRDATETMWAFNDVGPPLREIQIRRLNRYLIWYWQYLRLERGTGRGEEIALDAILAILAQRPILELAGPEVVARGERVLFALDTRRVNLPELAIYHEGRLFRHGARIGFPIDALLEGVRSRDGRRILDVLRAAFEQTVR